jgi:hypothetical protein
MRGGIIQAKPLLVDVNYTKRDKSPILRRVLQGAPYKQKKKQSENSLI